MTPMLTRFPFAFVAAAALLGVPSVTALTVEPVESTYEQSGTPTSFDQTHARLDRVLREFVTDDSRVKYRSLKARRGDLDAYLEKVSNVRSSDFDSWPEERQLALLINLYNAATLQLIVDHYPVKGIKKIGGPFKGPWKQPVVRLFGKVITLDTLEHGILRPQYREPRIHFAIVCAARGCPPLRKEAYTGAKLGAQLEDQGRRFLADTTKNFVDAKAIHLSPIFKWFAEDFTAGSGQVTDYVRSYFPEETARRIGGKRPVRYTHYDWSLNTSE